MNYSGIRCCRVKTLTALQAKAKKNKKSEWCNVLECPDELRGRISSKTGETCTTASTWRCQVHWTGVNIAKLWSCHMQADEVAGRLWRHWHPWAMSVLHRHSVFECRASTESQMPRRTVSRFDNAKAVSILHNERVQTYPQPRRVTILKTRALAESALYGVIFVEQIMKIRSYNCNLLQLYTKLYGKIVWMASYNRIFRE
jgi:hypothetical protein